MFAVQGFNLVFALFVLHLFVWASDFVVLGVATLGVSSRQFCGWCFVFVGIVLFVCGDGFQQAALCFVVSLFLCRFVGIKVWKCVMLFCICGSFLWI